MANMVQTVTCIIAQVQKGVRTLLLGGTLLYICPPSFRHRILRSSASQISHLGKLNKPYFEYPSRWHRQCLATGDVQFMLMCGASSSGVFRPHSDDIALLLLQLQQLFLVGSALVSMQTTDAAICPGEASLHNRPEAYALQQL